MINDELINYIKENKQKGFSDDIIKIALLEAGWKEEDINEGFKNGGIAISKSKSKKILPIIIVIVTILAGLFTLYRFSTWFDFLK